MLSLGVFTLGAVAADVAERSELDRMRTVDLAARLVDARLDTADAQLIAFAGRASLRAALRSHDSAGIAPHLSELKSSAHGYSSAVAFDAAGRMLAADPPGPIGRDFSQRDYFIGGMASNAPYTSEAFATAPGGPGPVAVAVSFAVREGSQVLGLILVGLLPQHVLESLDPLEKITGREILILDQARRVIAGTDPARVPLSSVDLPGVDLTIRGAARTTRVDVGGRERLVTHASIPSAGWTFLVIDDLSVVLSVDQRLARDLGQAALAASAAAAVAAGAITVLYFKVRRQRDELVAARNTLAAAKAQAEEASQAKSAFLAAMSHELRTPLNAVLGFAELLREQLSGTLAERQMRYLANIRQAGDHLLGLINDILDLSKVEAGRVDLRPERSTLASIAGPVTSSARAAAEARGVGFTAAVDEDSTVFVDVARTRQILYNLLSNAVKFTPPGGSVTLRAIADGRDVVIEVADTGVGIPSDQRDRVFAAFERLHEAQSDAPGTGLGLALTRRLVELHGGSISFESREGAGTTFRVTLPEAVRVPVSQDRILVVDDDRRDASLIAEMAAAVGLDHEIVGSRAEALAAIGRSTPRAVVLDLRLPDGRGEDVLASLKADPATRGVPVIVVTVEDDEGISRVSGADDHLTKPIDHVRLQEWLQRVASRQRA